MKKNNLYILLIIQALLSILLLFVESTMMYIALGLFLLIDLVTFASLLMKRWTAKELYIFITLFVSIIYILFLFYIKGEMLMVIAIGQMLLFLISAILSYDKTRFRTLPQPIKPTDFSKPISKSAHQLETYDLNEMEHELDVLDKAQRASRKEEAKYRAKALAYELEREAAEIKRAEKFVKKRETEAVESELVKEAKAIEDAARKANIVESALKEAELKRQAKELQDAEKKVREVELLNKQQELNRQAIELAKVQAEMNKAVAKKKIVKARPAKTAKTSKKENPVFATYNGNSFHETGCMVIKKIPKKNLILFNNPKEALKKGYKPCNVCKP